MISGAGLCWQHVGGVGSTTTTTTSTPTTRTTSTPTTRMTITPTTRTTNTPTTRTNTPATRTTNTSTTRTTNTPATRTTNTDNATASLANCNPGNDGRMSYMHSIKKATIGRSAATAIKKGTCNVQLCAILNKRQSMMVTIAGRAVEQTWGLQSCEGTILTLCRQK